MKHNMKLTPQDIGKTFKTEDGYEIVVTGFSAIWEVAPFNGFGFSVCIPHLNAVSSMNRDGVCRSFGLRLTK